MRDFSQIPEPEVFTLHQLVHRLTLRSGSKPTDRTTAMFVRAIQDAMRGLVGKHPWNYFRRNSRFTSSAPVDVTIAYDHTGGTHERLMTITGGTSWPADAALGEIRSGERRYRVHKRITTLQATLEPDFSLTGDLTGDYTWERRAYSFTREIEKTHYLHNLTLDRQVPFMPVTDFERESHYDFGGGYFDKFTWANHGGQFGTSEIILLPAPRLVETYEISATVKPIIPTIESEGGTDAAGTQAAYQVSSSQASFSQRLVGTVFRLSSDATPPTQFSSDKWTFQSFVTKVVDANTLELADPLPETFTGRGYVVSSPMDIEASIMLEAVEDEAYYQYTKNHDHKTLPQAKALARESLLQAIARDNRIGFDNRLWTTGGTWIFGYYGLVETDSTDTGGEAVAPEKTYYMTSLPANSFGADEDQVYITGGDLQGAVYERQAGVWAYIGVFELAIRDNDPDTGVLPVGFQWRLANQGDPDLNGVWEWDGFNAYQRVAD